MSDVSTFVSVGFHKPGICAGCQKVLGLDYTGWVRGVTIVDQGAFNIRVCYDSRITGKRSCKRSCVQRLQKRVSATPGPKISYFSKAEIERVIAIHMRVVR